MDKAPVITLDGPSGTGKGTIGMLLAERLGWHYLDSGALYRGLAWWLLEHQIAPEDKASIVTELPNILVDIDKADDGIANRISANGTDITGFIRTEPVSVMASKISAIPEVRARLLQLQQNMRKRPGLIADGRDMGTVVFPDAPYKFYLDASTSERAKRRFNQLKEQGNSDSLRNIRTELEKRDLRDEERAVSPLKPASDAVIIDTTDLSIDGVLEKVLQTLPANA